jgi:DNA-binding response OmpR family regulator
LDVLYRSGARVVARADLIEHVWPDEQGEGVSEQAVDALVRRLRDRLAELEPGHSYIVTVRGHGFRLDNPND